VQWFAAAHLLPQTSRTRWEQMDKPDIQRRVLVPEYQQFSILRRVRAEHQDGQAEYRHVSR
jgi:hypothetical protein